MRLPEGGGRALCTCAATVYFHRRCCSVLSVLQLGRDCCTACFVRVIHASWPGSGLMDDGVPVLQDAVFRCGVTMLGHLIYMLFHRCVVHLWPLAACALHTICLFLRWSPCHSLSMLFCFLCFELCLSVLVSEIAVFRSHAAALRPVGCFSSSS